MALTLSQIVKDEKKFKGVGWGGWVFQLITLSPQ